MAYSGKYIPENREKYKGDPRNVTYRSSWELQYMKWCDHSSKVIEWNSEEIIIPYTCPTDGRKHRYFTDFYVKTKDPKTGKISQSIIEIKPFRETQKPERKRGKPRARLLKEVKTYVKNQAKWAHASAWCKKKGWNFFVLTERDLFK